MITVMNSNNKPMNEVEKCLDSQLWHACAGGMVQMPRVSSNVFYFPQGHSEHAHEKVEFGSFARIPPLILCTVSGIQFLADTDTDEVFAKIRLVPLINDDYDFDNDNEDHGYLDFNKSGSPEKPASFAKTLTQSDANNGGGFSVPGYCAETIFPRLDYSAEPPVQMILVKDVHGEIWKFRHIYRGTPRRHLLTTGWSNFVNQKKLVAGDSIVFLRADNGDLCVGIRRTKRGIGGGDPDSPSGWNALCGNSAFPFVGYSAFLREDETKSMRSGSGGGCNANGAMRGKEGRVRTASVIEAATMAANGQPFEVVYYPRASAPEFCVKASAVRASMKIQWCPGMKFKMAFETEDSSRISWFMGTISSVQVDDPIRWPNSPWRFLQVTWDEPDLLQNVKQVSPWLVELVSNMPAIHLSSFSPPRKKMRISQPPDFPFIEQYPMPSFPSSLRTNNPFYFASDDIPASIQGARHAHFGLSSADHHFNTLQPGSISQPVPMAPTEDNENLSCLLTMGVSIQNSKKCNEVKAPMFLLFGQPIHTEEQISQSSSDGNQEKTYCSDGSGSGVVQSEDGLPLYKDNQKSEFGQCKVFMESDDVGRTLDLTALGSYEELYRKLANMFSVDGPEMLNNVLYRDVLGAVKHTEDEPFSVFSRTAKRLTILMDSGSDNMGR